MTWRRVIIGLALLALAVAAALQARSARPSIAYTSMHVQLAPPVQSELARAWRVYARNVRATEYAYCITRYEVRMENDSTPTIYVKTVLPAKAYAATPVSIDYSCGPFPALHAHPPNECDVNRGGEWVCTPGPEIPELCEPSDTDLEAVLTDWHRFHGIQCSATTVAFFIPEFTTP